MTPAEWLAFVGDPCAPAQAQPGEPLDTYARRIDDYNGLRVQRAGDVVAHTTVDVDDADRVIEVVAGVEGPVRALMGLASGVPRLLSERLGPGRDRVWPVSWAGRPATARMNLDMWGQDRGGVYVTWQLDDLEGLPDPPVSGALPDLLALAWAHTHAVLPGLSRAQALAAAPPAPWLHHRDSSRPTGSQRLAGAEHLIELNVAIQDQRVVSAAAVYFAQRPERPVLLYDALFDALTAEWGPGQDQAPGGSLACADRGQEPARLVTWSGPEGHRLSLQLWTEYNRLKGMGPDLTRLGLRVG